MQPTKALPAKKNLLLCLDAFGTLFTPTKPIGAVYAEAAVRHGVPTGGSDNAHEVGDLFKAAFKGETKRNPIYGKATGLGAEKWWANVIRNTFSSYLKPEQEVPPELITELYQDYGTSRPYSLYFDVRNLIDGMRAYRKSYALNRHPAPYGRLVVGIITNSDDRVPSILQSFHPHNIRIGSKRAGASSQVATQPSRWVDIDFVVQSYDVGHEKPDRRIFDAATSLLSETLANEGKGVSADDFEKLYIGDDLENDYLGARAAGWDAVLIDRKGVTDKTERYNFDWVVLKNKEGREREVLMAKSLLDIGHWQQLMSSKASTVE